MRDNLLSKASKRRLDQAGVLDILVRGGISREKLPKDVLVLERFDEIDDEPDTFIPNCKDLLDFVNASTGVQIHSTEVAQLRVDEFEKMREELTARIIEIEQQREQESAQHQEQLNEIARKQREAEEKWQRELGEERQRRKEEERQRKRILEQNRRVQEQMRSIQARQRQLSVPSNGNFSIFYFSIT